MDVIKKQFGEMWAAKMESAPGTDGLPYSVCQCVGEFGSQLLFAANIELLDGFFSAKLRSQQKKLFPSVLWLMSRAGSCDLFMR